LREWGKRGAEAIARFIFHRFFGDFLVRHRDFISLLFVILWLSNLHLVIGIWKQKTKGRGMFPHAKSRDKENY
jgi:hypothetical protein